jgi:hypothetical protein
MSRSSRGRPSPARSLRGSFGRARGLLAAGTLAWSAFSWPASARGEHGDTPPPAPTLEQVEAARVPFRESRELYRQGKLNEAVARMLDAYEIARTPVIALEAGRLLVEAGHLVKARDLLRGVPALPASPRESDAGRDARRSAGVLATELDARIPKISIAARPAGVDVLLDGKALSGADATAWLGTDPGTHNIVVSADEHVCTTITITLAEGQVRTIDLRDAALTCDRANPSPAPSPSASEAFHPAALAPTPPVSPAWHWGGPLAVAAAGAAAIGVGMFLVVQAKGDYDSVSCTPGGCDAEAFNVRHAAHDHANVATAVVSVGAAAIGGGALWLVLSHPGGASGAAPRVGIAPSSVALVVPIH